ncbi:hypothetical protein F5050DRAFT_1804217 [Lentinula boryana]|uniref:Uncharacterized protein n=1 Tax=Lentinula boryana TaxID=40481 RepID=A0ABQ8QPJ7_9AGAR|nr:hypothetical protein F5050DRAFT_1804217 [Lentinula boryana]
MAADSMFVFDANPHAPSIISSAEEALVRTLFANFDTAWNHPALQTRLIRACHQPSRQSILNGMTLFGAIWSASKLPNFRPYKVVWDAMRVHLENDGVLAALVSKFNAYVASVGIKTTDSRLVQLQTHLEDPQAPGSFTSIPREDAGHHQTKKIKSLGEKFSKSDKLSPTYFLQEPSPPAHRNREAVYYSQSPSSHLSTCSICSEHYANEARTCNEGSSYPQDSEFYHYPLLSSGSSGSEVRTQTDIYHETFPGGSTPFVPVFPDTTSYSYLGLTYGMGHGKEQLSEPDAAEMRQTPGNIGIASNPPNLAFHDHHHLRFPELNSYVNRRQAHQSNTMHLPYSTAAYNLPFSRSQDAYWGGCVERGSECDRYNGLQNDGSANASSN